jgi:transposase
MSEHGHRMINRMLKREGLNWKKWQIHRRGLESNWAVEEKVKQYYEIIRLE